MTSTTSASTYPPVTMRRSPVFSSIGSVASRSSACCVEIDGWNVEVRAVERHSITEVALTPIVPQHSEDPS